MAVGNDVVDLRDPETRPGALHPRWNSRVFAPEEFEAMGPLADPASTHRLRWRMWAAKESAFKAARKISRDVRFFPTAFVVELCGAAGALVRHETGRFAVHLHETTESLHAVATPEGSAPASSQIEAVSELASAGERVRALARKAIGAALGHDPRSIEIAKIGGVPVASAGGMLLPIDLSLSHHGRFVACAWAETARHSSST